MFYSYMNICAYVCRGMYIVSGFFVYIYIQHMHAHRIHETFRSKGQRQSPLVTFQDKVGSEGWGTRHAAENIIGEPS